MFPTRWFSGFLRNEGSSPEEDISISSQEGGAARGFRRRFSETGLGGGQRSWDRGSDGGGGPRLPDPWGRSRPGVRDATQGR